MSFQTKDAVTYDVEHCEHNKPSPIRYIVHI